MTELTYHCELIDEQTHYTLVEVCRLSGASEDIVVAMVREGLVEVRGARQDEWTLDAMALRRVGTAVRLQRDLGVNLPGAALALDLLEEIERLRRARRAPSGHG